MGRLRDKVAIATAAAQGIGRATVKRFAQEGATVYACDVQEDKIKQLKAEIGDSVIPVALDVTDALAVREFATRVDQEQKTIDVLFNCVGHVPEGTIHECDDEQWYRAININTKSVHNMCKAFIPRMDAKNPEGDKCIVNTASVASSVLATANRYLYMVTKGAVIALTKSLAHDHVQLGFRINCVCPGTVNTESWRNERATTPELRKAFEARQAMGRVATPEEIADLVLYIAAEATYTTGEEFIIDGGWKNCAGGIGTTTHENLRQNL
jgi:NAD(P)-dependent dehydrogenase (short-subunit alcohol dehydrogenase family)